MAQRIMGSKRPGQSRYTDGRKGQEKQPWRIPVDDDGTAPVEHSLRPSSINSETLAGWGIYVTSIDDHNDGTADVDFGKATKVLGNTTVAVSGKVVFDAAWEHGMTKRHEEKWKQGQEYKRAHPKPEDITWKEALAIQSILEPYPLSLESALENVSVNGTNGKPKADKPEDGKFQVYMRNPAFDQVSDLDARLRMRSKPIKDYTFKLMYTWLAIQEEKKKEENPEYKPLCRSELYERTVSVLKKMRHDLPRIKEVYPMGRVYINPQDAGLGNMSTGPFASEVSLTGPPSSTYALFNPSLVLGIAAFYAEKVPDHIREELHAMHGLMPARQNGNMGYIDIMRPQTDDPDFEVKMPEWRRVTGRAPFSGKTAFSTLNDVTLLADHEGRFIGMVDGNFEQYRNAPEDSVHYAEHMISKSDPCSFNPNKRL